MKGQFCRTKYQANVVWGWSHRIYDWTVVLPWSFGKLLTPLVAQINAVACKDIHNMRRLDAHTQDLQRDYSSTVKQRAHERCLTTRVHRQHYRAAQLLCSSSQACALVKRYCPALSRVEFDFYREMFYVKEHGTESGSEPIGSP